MTRAGHLEAGTSVPEFGLGRPDVLATGDYGIKVGMQKLFALPDLPKPAEMERLAAPWRPHRSAARWSVWRSLEFGKWKEPK